MSDPFPHLFSPLKVGSYTLANRIMNTGHAAHFQTGDGLPTRGRPRVGTPDPPRPLVEACPAPP